MKWRIIEEKLFIGVTGLAGIFTSLLLILIIGKIFIEAIPSLDWVFIASAESQRRGFGNAIGNAIVGTLLISMLSVICATPISIGTAIYLKKYSSDNIFTKTLRFLIEVLSGTPSIILGVFGLIILVYYLKPITGGFSLLSGSIALAILIMPVIIRATEEAIGSVPVELEHASYALGATKWETIHKIVIPYAMSGIITGIVLGSGRAAEESAVVMLTAGYSQFFPSFDVVRNSEMAFGIQILPLQDLVGVLPITIYHAYEFSTTVPLSNAFAASLILILIVMLINASARLILWKWKIG